MNQRYVTSLPVVINLSSSKSPQAYFSKIFNGCPLHFNCAMVWMHPTTKGNLIFLLLLYNRTTLYNVATKYYCYYIM